MVDGELSSVDGIEVLDRLREVDELTLRFSSWGLGGRLEPPESAAFLAELMSHAQLADAVPEEVRLGFERVRRTFMYGLLEYDLFTAAYSLGHLVLEGALRSRFITYYDGEIPILTNGATDLLVAHSFAEYYKSLRRGGRGSQKLKLAADPPEPLPQSYPDLYAWAQRRGLLFGQRNVGVFGSIVRLRNHIAHPEGHMVDTPPSVFRFLRDLTEIVNRLWGQDTEGGRLFPGPITRWVRVAAVAPDGSRAVTFSSLAQVRVEEDSGDWAYAVYLAAADEDLTSIGVPVPGGIGFTYRPGFQATDYPARLLWGPGGRDELIAALELFSDEAPIDEVPFLDRIFYIRVTRACGVELPRDRHDVLATKLNDDEAVWHVVRADFPTDAFVLVRDGERTDELARNKQFVAELSGDHSARAHAATETAQ